MQNVLCVDSPSTIKACGPYKLTFVAEFVPNQRKRYLSGNLFDFCVNTARGQRVMIRDKGTPLKNFKTNSAASSFNFI